jgi:hypothetical protein
MARCRWSRKAPGPARGFQGAAKRPWVDGCRESENLPCVLHRQNGDHGVSGSLEAPSSGAGPAITVLHGLVQVERDSSKPCEWLTGDTVYDAKGSMPHARHASGRCNGGAPAGPLAKIVRVIPHTSCEPSEVALFLVRADACCVYLRQGPGARNRPTQLFRYPGQLAVTDDAIGFPLSGQFV